MKDALKNKLIETLKAAGIERGLCKIEFAYDLAKLAHNGQFRDGGKEYITHPVEGCLIMARDYKITDPDMHTAFLMHDVGEDCAILGDRHRLPYPEFALICEARAASMFGKRVASLIARMTKPAIDGITFKTKAEMMAHYLAFMEEDPDAVFLKMMDRLHNLRSLPADDAAKIERQIEETENLLLPLFKRTLASKEEKDKMQAPFKKAIKDTEAEIEELKQH